MDWDAAVVWDDEDQVYRIEVRADGVAVPSIFDEFLFDCGDDARAFGEHMGVLPVSLVRH